MHYVIVTVLLIAALSGLAVAQTIGHFVMVIAAAVCGLTIGATAAGLSRFLLRPFLR